MHSLYIALSFVVVSSATGQSTQTEPIAAPAPSARFPAAWYQGNVRPSDATPSTHAPVTGAPYSATMVTSYTMPASPERPGEGMSQRTMQYRDGAGRTRTEQSRAFVKLSTTELTEGPKEIEVNDVVTHCMFHWGEPWTGQGQPIATVSCFPRMYFSPWDTSWGVKAQTASEVHKSANETIRNEPLGHKIIGGLNALGTRSTTINLQPARTDQPAETQEVVLERWWSPHINEVIRFGPVPPQSGLPTFELKDIHPGEPDPALFYPPDNYKIVSQSDPYH